MFDLLLAIQITDILLLSLAILLLIFGLLGCFLPVIPGPPLSWIALLVFTFTEYSSLSVNFLILTGIIMIIITVLDYIFPVWLTKKMGGTKAGITGATVGLFIGLFIFPPFGIIFGPVIGAFIAELIAKNSTGVAFKSALGSFVGFLLGTGVKLIFSFLMIYYVIKELIV